MFQIIKYFHVTDVLLNPILKLTFIFISIFLHFFNVVGLFDSHPLPTQLHIAETIDFVGLNVRVDFLLHIAGGYCLGKLADKVGFPNVMKIICLTYIITSVLLTFLDALNIFESGMLLCLVHGIHSFLRVSSFILPIVYIFQHYGNQSCYKYSALAWIAVLVGMMANNIFINLFTSISYSHWCMAYAVSGVISLAIYYYVGSEQTAEIKKVPKLISKPALIMSLLLSGICTMGIVHQCYSLQHYVIGVIMPKTLTQQLIHSPFWVTVLFMLLPAAQITKNFEMVKILKISLSGIIFSISLFYIFSPFQFLNDFILFAHQVIFGVFFSLFLPPTLIFTYRILQGRNSYFYMTFLFSLSLPTFSLVITGLEKLDFLPSFLLGAFLIIAMMLVCLWMNQHYRIFSSQNLE